MVDVLLVGPYPPPFGGVSAHIERLAAGIADAGLTVAVLNHFKSINEVPVVIGDLNRNPWRYWRALQSPKARIVHYHHARWSTLMATSLALRSRQRPAAAITVHGHGLTPFIDGTRRSATRLTQTALKSFDRLIAVSPEIAEGLVLVRPASDVAVIPAYLPPGIDESAAALLADDQRFMDRGWPTLLVSAYRLTTDRAGQMIYGLDFAIDLFAALAEHHPRMQLAIFLAMAPQNAAERQRFEKLNEHVAEAGIRDRVRICIDQPLVPAFASGPIFLRPTTTDGDAVAVREALSAGCPVVASDVVARPAGTRSRPLERGRWLETLEQLVGQQGEPGEIAHVDNLQPILEIYESLLVG
jgi:glycosyltransferase involved in cell wall biosynthesis